MTRQHLKLLPTLVLLLLVAACHPEGCYGPKAFDYNTKPVVTSDLFGSYTLDGPHVILEKYAFTNYTGSIQLKPDMTFVCSDIPSIFYPPKPGVYFSSTGQWEVVHNGNIWEVKLHSPSADSLAGFGSLTLPILNEAPPHGLELTINHDEGYFIRYRRSKAYQPSTERDPR